MSYRTEFLFAHWAVRALKDLRGPQWKKLVEHVAGLPEPHPDAMAFALMMIRLNGCMTCDARKYLERGGCARCATTTLTFSKETEASLLARYRAARKEIAQTLKEQEQVLPQAA